MKQKNIPWLGAFLETFFTTIPFINILSLCAILLILYTNIRPYLVQYTPWMTLWLFLGIVALIGVVGMVLVYKFVMASLWSFRGRQMDVKEVGKNGVVVAVSGGFDPIHRGHVRYIREAMKLGDKIIVILSTDEVLIRKKGKPFMEYAERAEIIEAIIGDKGRVVPNVCRDGIDCIESLRLHRPNIFAKGGDTWDEKNLPEYQVCQELGIKIVFGVGGYEKIQSSSNLIAGGKK